MVSLDVYEKLKREVNQLLSKEENLLDDDDFLLELTSKAKDSKAVLGLAKELKEEGNVLYKEKKFEEALEKYGYAGVILARHDFQEDDCRAGYFDLVICILLNAAACLSKRKEFMQVGQICTIILESDERNVKAWYRRAVAAVEVGRTDLAYWDLLIAHEVDPGNKEVISKLEEVKSTRLKDNRARDKIPLGLGVGLSPSKKPKLNDGFEIDSASLKRKDDCKSNLGSGHKKENECAMCNEDGESHEVGESQVCPNVSEEKIREAKENMTEATGTTSTKQESGLFAKPKYRFSNRRRPNFSMTISRSDYQHLLKGKTIQYFNSKLSSPMSIRVVTCPRESSKRPDACQEEEVREPIIGTKSNDSLMEDMVVDSTIQLKESEVRRSNEEIQHHNFKNGWNASKESGFWFTSLHKQWNTELEEKVRKRILRWKMENASKKKKKDQQAFGSTTVNSMVVCRFQAGMKRKQVASCSDSLQHPRKKSSFESCRNVMCVTSNNSVSCRYLDLGYPSSSIESTYIDYSRSVYASQEMAISH